MHQREVTDWTDVPVTARHGIPHWPDNPPIVLERVMDTGCNVSHLAMGVRGGTHRDGPVHRLHQAPGPDEMPPTATMGEARGAGIDDPRQITAGELRTHRLRAGERVLFKTMNSARCWPAGRFAGDFAYICQHAALHLAQAGVQTAGIDYLSAGGYHGDGAKIHRIPPEAGIWIIEGPGLSPSPAAGTR